MKKNFILIVIVYFTLFIKDCMSQLNWYEVNPYPTSNDIYQLNAINSNIVYGAGGAGTVIKSTNAGGNWTLLPYFAQNINAFSFKDANTGIAGTYNSIYRTTNGGVNWETILIAQGFDFYSGAYIGNNTFIITANPVNLIGVLSRIYRTSDLGANFTIQEYSRDSTGYAFWETFFINNTTGFINGSCYNNTFRLLKTTDAGVTWNYIYNSMPVPILTRSIYFLNENTGFVVGNFNYIGKTTNGGYNWISIKYNPSVYGTGYRNIRFLDQNKGMIVGSTCLRTTDGGDNWRMMDSANLNNLNDVVFLDNNNLIMTGVNARIYSSTNAGLNWSRMDKNIFGDYSNRTFTGCALLNPYKAIVGDGKEIFKTNDGGLNWQKDTNILAGKFCFIDPNTGMTVSQSGYAIYRTTNGGENWFDKSPTDFNDRYYDVKFINDQTGIVAGYSTNQNSLFALRLTTNGGNNWIRKTHNYINYCKACEMIDKDTFYVASDYIYKTTNGGNNWTNQTQYYDGNYTFIKFLNSSTGFAGSSGSNPWVGVLWKTTNGGALWYNTYYDYSMYPTSINFNPNNNIILTFSGYVNSEYVGKIMLSTDMGINWSIVYNTSGENIYDMSFCDSIHGIACGSKGLILFSYPPGKSTNVKNNSNNDVPSSYFLYQNYPNPFNPTTSIKYSVSSNQNVRLFVYDILGKEVETLVNEKQSPGMYEVTFDGSKFASGIYFYQMKTGDFIEAKRMVLIK